MRRLLSVVLCVLLLFSGCAADSYSALGSVETGTGTSWKQKHYLLNGTKHHHLNLGADEQNMEIEVVTEEGEIDITINRSGENILFIDDAKTGIYGFCTDGKVSVTIEAKNHRGSVAVRKAES